MPYPNVVEIQGTADAEHVYVDSKCGLCFRSLQVNSQDWPLIYKCVGTSRQKSCQTLSAAPTFAPRLSSSRADPAAPPYAAKCSGTHPSCAVRALRRPDRSTGSASVTLPCRSAAHLITLVWVHVALIEHRSHLANLILASGIVEAAHVVPHGCGFFVTVLLLHFCRSDTRGALEVGISLKVRFRNLSEVARTAKADTALNLLFFPFPFFPFSVLLPFFPQLLGSSAVLALMAWWQQPECGEWVVGYSYKALGLLL